jgi:SAM-dependent methyltransferase
MNLELIKHLQEKPEPFVPCERLFWDDPHISKGMLSAHLNPENDLASRRPETIERSVDWMINTLDLRNGASVLDLGCGPGLYSMSFAQHGFCVTGLDYSSRSIGYAIVHARQHDLEIDYRYQNYLTLEVAEQYDAALLIYGDFCPLAPDQRKKLLNNVYHALKPGGHFVLDVTTRAHRKLHGSVNRWYTVENGFWRKGQHLVLEQGFDYPEYSIYLDQIIVVDADDKVSVYRNWFQDYTRESITNELESGGFAVESIWNDLLGTPYSEDAEWIGVIARKE